LGKTGPVMALILFSLLTFISIIPVHGAAMFTPEDQFVIPEYNSQFNFAVGGSYDSASLENNTWNFAGLALDSYILNLTAGGGVSGVLYGRDVLNYSRNDGNFSVSAHNCNITIANYDLILHYGPSTGWLNYTVKGVGTQTFNLHYFSAGIGPINWTVYIDGVAKPQNEGWAITTDEWLTVSGATSNASIHYERIYPPKDDIDEPDYLGLFVMTLLFVIIMVFLIPIVAKGKKKAKNSRSLSKEKLRQEKQ